MAIGVDGCFEKKLNAVLQSWPWMWGQHCGVQKGYLSCELHWLVLCTVELLVWKVSSDFTFLLFSPSGQVLLAAQGFDPVEFDYYENDAGLYTKLAGRYGLWAWAYGQWATYEYHLLLEQFWPILKNANIMICPIDIDIWYGRYWWSPISVFQALVKTWYVDGHPIQNRPEIMGDHPSPWIDMMTIPQLEGNLTDPVADRTWGKNQRNFKQHNQ